MKIINKISNLIKRNPCRECEFYSESNNVCNSKKCATTNPYVTRFDRMFCEPYKGESEDKE